MSPMDKKKAPKVGAARWDDDHLFLSCCEIENGRSGKETRRYKLTTCFQFSIPCEMLVRIINGKVFLSSLHLQLVFIT